MESNKTRHQPLTDDEMKVAFRPNVARQEGDLAGVIPADDLTESDIKELEALDREEASKAEREALQHEKDGEASALRARGGLFRSAIKRYDAWAKENSHGYYPKKRKADRDKYAAEVMAEKGRPVRPYADLSGMTPEQVADREREQARLRKQAARARGKT